MTRGARPLGLSTGPLAASGLVIGLVSAAILAIFLFAPTEATMGQVQRIVYLHVAVAWCGLAAFVFLGVASGIYLVSRDLAWDRRSQAAGEIGWLCTTLTLVTGSMWAHAAWNTWWTWDPRLTASLVLWTIYGGYFLVRSGVEERHRRARISAVLGLLGATDIPLVVVATRWFRGMHPVAPEMDPRMRLVLLASVVGFTAVFAYVARRRCRQLLLAEQVESLERQAGAARPADWT